LCQSFRIAILQDTGAFVPSLFWIALKEIEEKDSNIDE